MRKPPGVEFDVELGFQISGLDPTIVILDDQGDAVYGPTTDGIIELEVASQPTGTYLATIPAGTLTIRDDGYTILASRLGTFDPDTDDIISIDLEITYDLGGSATPTGRDLCTLQDVLDLLPGYTQSDTVEAKLQGLITEESELIQEVREIVPARDQPEARDFDISLWDQQDGEIKIGDLQTMEGLEVEIRTASGDTVRTIDVEEDVTALYRFGRRQPRSTWEPIVALRFRRYLTANRVLHVTGTWGFAAIPPHIREATAKRVLLRYLSDVAAREITDAVESLNLAAMFASARDAIDSLDDGVYIS